MFDMIQIDAAKENWMTRILFACLLVVLTHCASKSSDVLEELDTSTVKAGDAESAVENTELRTLLDTLESQGYQGVGLQYESSASIQLLTKVFSNPTTHGRKIQLIYTGLKTAYDNRYQSFTINSESTEQAILSFIESQIPKKEAEPSASESKKE